MKKLMIKTGTYQKDGQTKNRWTQLGVIMSNENGEYALLDPSVNLAGCLMQQNAIDPQRASARLMVSVFEQDSQRAPQSAPQPTVAQGSITVPPPSQQNSNSTFDDDIPF